MKVILFLAALAGLAALRTVAKQQSARGRGSKWWYVIRLSIILFILFLSLFLVFKLDLSFARGGTRANRRSPR